MRLVEIHVVPIWEEADGARRPPQPDEVRGDLPCVAWGLAAVVQLARERRWFLLSHMEPA